MNSNEFLDDIAESLANAAAATGKRLTVSAADLALYLAARADHLVTVVGEPGYARAVEAELSNVALRGGINATLEADAADARIVGVIQGTLRTLVAAGIRGAGIPFPSPTADGERPAADDSEGAGWTDGHQAQD